MRAYKETLYGIPAYRTTKTQYKNKTLAEILKEAKAGNIPQEDRLNPVTISNHCGQIATLLKWAARNEYHNNSTLTGLLQVRLTKQAHEYRDPYSRDDLAKIFKPENFIAAGLSARQGSRQQSKAD